MTTWQDDPAEAMEMLRDFYRDPDLSDRNRTQLTSFILWPDGLPEDVQDALRIYEQQDEQS